MCESVRTEKAKMLLKLVKEFRYSQRSKVHQLLWLHGLKGRLEEEAITPKPDNALEMFAGIKSLVFGDMSS